MSVPRVSDSSGPFCKALPFRRILLLLIFTVSAACFPMFTEEEEEFCDFNTSDIKFYGYGNTSGKVNVDSLTIGFLGAYGLSQTVLGALPLAIKDVNENPTLLPGKVLRFVTRDIGLYRTREDKKKTPSDTLAISVMTEMRDNGTIAFIFPEDTCSSVALVAAAWNFPIISYKCADTAVSDKTVYTTFSRTLPPTSKVSKSVVSLLLAFDWKAFIVIAGSKIPWAVELAEAIKERSEAQKLTVTATRTYNEMDPYLPSHVNKMDTIVGETYQITRVYVFVGEHIALVDFILCLQHRQLLDSGEYIIISVDDEVYDPDRKFDIIFREYYQEKEMLRERAESLKRGFRSVLKLSPSHPTNPAFHKVCNEIKQISKAPPFCVPYNPRVFDSISVPIHAAYLYDAVMIYARALTEILESNGDPKDGKEVMRRITNRSYRSLQGFDIFIDNNGDAEGNFTVVALLDDSELNSSMQMSMQPVGYFRYEDQNDSITDLPEFLYIDQARPIPWLSGKPPLFEPECGFKGEYCGIRSHWRIIAAGAAFATLMGIAAAFLLKHYRYEQKLACLLWRVDMKDVIPISKENLENSTINKALIRNNATSQYNLTKIWRPRILNDISHEEESKDDKSTKAYTLIGSYRGNIVAVKRIKKRTIDITRNIRLELKQMREARHENILPFVGASIDPGLICILTKYCTRGSVEDVLLNKDIRVDTMFISSLVNDIIKGMIYIHDSEIISHGNLRASNCLVDSKWVLQLSDFGLHEFRAGQEDHLDIDKIRKRALYTAPELLRSHCRPSRGTQEGDVYSFGIVLYEIIGRKGPWGDTDLSDEEIIRRVKSGPLASSSPFRPFLGDLAAADYVSCCIQSCWDENPDHRPDMPLINVKLKEMQSGLQPNIFDNMLAIMEKYAFNLEGLVEARTIQLSEEKLKTEALLHRMLPTSVAKSLILGEPVQAESFECVTIFFSDIVSFTELSARSTPLQVVEMLNDLYTCCDSVISNFDVYKIETIGDAYMVASGLPMRNEDRHAAQIASLSLNLLEHVKRLRIRHMPSELLKLRIGIHSGQCVAGVVGLKMPRYCLFGDTVNTASRMESTGLPFRIHVSSATYELLAPYERFKFKERGMTFIKGKGEMRTYWLISEDQTKEVPGLKRFNASTKSIDFPLDAPDLLRGSAGIGPVSNDVSEFLTTSTGTSPQLLNLHQRARLSCETLAVQDRIVGYGSSHCVPYPCSCIVHNRPLSIISNCRGHSSAPTVTFRDNSIVSSRRFH